MIFLLAFAIHFIEITFPSQVVEDVTPILYTSPEPKVGLTKYLKDLIKLKGALYKFTTGQRAFYCRIVSL